MGVSRKDDRMFRRPCRPVELQCQEAVMRRRRVSRYQNICSRARSCSMGILGPWDTTNCLLGSSDGTG